MEYEKIIRTVMYMLMMAGGLYDVRRKAIPVWCIAAGFAGAAFCMACRGNTTVQEAAVDAGPGAVCLLISLCTHEKIGYGDGLVIMIMGLIMHAGPCIYAFASGLMFASVFSAAMMALHRFRLSTRIPFVPFLAAGTGVVAWLM